MDVVAVFAGTWAIFKQKFGLFLLTMLAAAGVVTVGVVVVALVIAGSIGSMVTATVPSAGAIIVMVLGSLAVFVMVYLVMFKVQAMVMLGAYEIAQGRTPTFSGLLSGTRGFLPRLAVLFLLGFVAVILIGVLLGLIFAGIGASFSSSGNSAAGLGMTGVMMVTILIVIVVGYYIGVKLLYVVPLVALDQLDGISALKRSWQLTNGAFWRTLGYLLLMAVAISVGSTIVSFVAQIFMIPAMAPLSALEYTTDSAAVVAGLLAAAPFLVIPIVLYAAYQVVVTPLIHVYVTVMYIDQVRRADLPPGYVAPPGAGYAQPGFPPVNPGGYPPPPPPPPVQPY